MVSDRVAQGGAGDGERGLDRRPAEVCVCLRRGDHTTRSRDHNTPGTWQPPATTVKHSGKIR